MDSSGDSYSVKIVMAIQAAHFLIINRTVWLPCEEWPGNHTVFIVQMSKAAQADRWPWYSPTFFANHPTGRGLVKIPLNSILAQSFSLKLSILGGSELMKIDFAGS